jgi:hypothetical protein
LISKPRKLVPTDVNDADVLVADAPTAVVAMGTVIKLGRPDRACADGWSAAADDASLRSTWGSADMSCGPFDMIDCPTAAACPVTPAGLVVGGGEVKGVNVDAVADEPA